MKRCLLLALVIAVLSPSSVTIACNCNSTRAQRWLAYKAYKEKMALQRERLLAEQQRARQRKTEPRRKQTTTDSGDNRNAQAGAKTN